MTSAIYQDGTYLERNPTWHAEDSRWKAERIIAMLRRHRLDLRAVAEIGCGAGGVLRHVAESLGPNVRCDGYEISAVAHTMARAAGGGPNVEYHLADMLETSTPHVDLVMAIDVIEHVEDYLGFLRRLRAKGTYKLFHIPLDMSAQMVIRNEPLLQARSLVGHLHYFSKDTALASLVDTGYELIDHVYTDGAISLPARHWKARLMRWPRRALFTLQPDLAVRTLGGYSLLVLAR